MRTIETVIYHYDELSDEAKERARQWYREVQYGASEFIAEPVLNDAVAVADLMGIEIERRHWTNSHGFKGCSPVISYCAGHVQSDGASFAGRYKYRKGARKAVHDYAPLDNELHRIAQALQDIQARNFYQLAAVISEGRGMYVRAEVERANDKSMTPNAENEIGEIMRDFAHWIYKQILAEFDYQSSDEAVEESIIANQYEFTEKGTLPN